MRTKAARQPADGDTIRVTDASGAAIPCPECGHVRFIATLLLPGGLRVSCRGCAATFTPGQLADTARRPGDVR